MGLASRPPSQCGGNNLTLTSSHHPNLTSIEVVRSLGKRAYKMIVPTFPEDITKAGQLLTSVAHCVGV